MNRKTILRYIRIAIYIGILISLIILKINGTSSFGSCYIKENFGITCPTCRNN